MKDRLSRSLWLEDVASADAPLGSGAQCLAPQVETLGLAVDRVRGREADDRRGAEAPRLLVVPDGCRPRRHVVAEDVEVVAVVEVGAGHRRVMPDRRRRVGGALGRAGREGRLAEVGAGDHAGGRRDRGVQMGPVRRRSDLVRGRVGGRGDGRDAHDEGDGERERDQNSPHARVPPLPQLGVASLFVCQHSASTLLCQAL